MLNATALHLEPGEPAPWESFNATGKGRLLLVADHASNRVPRCLDQLGLDAGTLASHIAWDAGTAVVARHLAKLLDAPLIQANYSRLVIDLNRAAGSPQSILAMSDGIEIPANRDLHAAHVASRRTLLFDPYHDAIRQLLDLRGREVRVVVSIHSFNPVLAGIERPWTIGVCYGDDARLARIVLPVLSQNLPDQVGDNAPYSIEADIDFTLPHHAASRGMLHVMLEIRRDRIEREEDAVRMAALLHRTWIAIAAQLPEQD